MDLDLFTIHHKEDVNIGVMQKHFTPMQVGCALSKIDLNIRRDDAFGTISHKNPNYCELTAFDDLFHALNLDGWRRRSAQTLSKKRFKNDQRLLSEVYI